MRNSILLKYTSIELRTQHCYASDCELCEISIFSDARKSKVSMTNYMRVCWFSEHVFFMFDHFTWSDFERCPSHSKTFKPQPNSGKISVNSTHACFSRIQSYTKTFSILSVDLPSCGYVKIFTIASCFTSTLVRGSTSNRTSLTNSS